VARYYTDDGDGVLLPFSSPYGPGALWFETSLEAKPFGDWLLLGLDLFVLSKNTQASLVTTAYERSSTVENAPRTVLVELGLPVETHFSTSIGTALLGFRPSMSFLDGQLSMNMDLRFGMKMGGSDGALKQY
jgi:hypothetical protein